MLMLHDAFYSYAYVLRYHHTTSILCYTVMMCVTTRYDRSFYAAMLQQQYSA
jgi:hypothetical protein